MKFVYLAVFVVLFSVVQAPCVLAAQLQESRSEADQYYQQGNFKKAYKGYFKLAKTGDNYSQHRVSEMYANGEGKKLTWPKPMHGQPWQLKVARMSGLVTAMSCCSAPKTRTKRWKMPANWRKNTARRL
jgi:hypothetical protein